MKRTALACLLVLCFTVPASATPRRDDSDWQLVPRVIRSVADHIVRLFDNWPTIPHP